MSAMKSFSPYKEFASFIERRAPSRQFALWKSSSSTWVPVYQTTDTLPSVTNETRERLQHSSSYIIHDVSYQAFDPYILVVQGETPALSEEELTLVEALIELAERRGQHSSLQLLMEVARVIASSIHDDNVLELIIHSAVDAIPHADTGFLFLFDDKLQKLVVKSAVGFKQEYYRMTRLSRGEGISGLVFDSGEPIIINGAAEIADVMTNMTNENLTYYLNSTILADYPYSVVCVPLLHEQKTLGVLTINNFTKDTIFTTEDQHLLQAFADQVAVAIYQIGLFHKERAQREELVYIHNALHKEHGRLQRTIDLHNELTNIAAKGKGTQAILNALQKSVQMPVDLYDSVLNVRSKPPVYQALPQNFFALSAVKLLLERRKWQTMEVDDHHLLLVPIFGPDYLLGFLCAWAPATEENYDAVFLLEYGATVLALEWTKEEAIRETKSRVRGEIIDQLLSGVTDGAMVQQAEQLGLSESNAYVILLSRAHPGYSSQQKLQDRDRQKWMQAIDQSFMNSPLTSISLYYHRYLLTIISFPNELPVEERMGALKKGLASLVDQAPSMQSAVGRIYTGLRRLERSYKDAISCFSLFEQHSLPQPILNYSELGAFRLFLEHDRKKLEHFLEDMLGPLLLHDKQSSQELTNTLVAYVIYDKHVQHVSDTLNIHYNTIYYRLKKIQQILGFTFDDPNDWFNIQLACYVYHFLEGNSLT